MYHLTSLAAARETQSTLPKVELWKDSQFLRARTKGTTDLTALLWTIVTIIKSDVKVVSLTLKRLKCLVTLRGYDHNSRKFELYRRRTIWRTRA